LTAKELFKSCNRFFTGEFASFYFLPILAEYGLAAAFFSRGLSTEGSGMLETPVSYRRFKSIFFFIGSGAKLIRFGLIFPIPKLV
jgi:hypothetical protein